MYLGFGNPTTYTLNGRTIGLTFQYAPTSWWSHEFELGQDVDNVTSQGTVAEYANPGDTLLTFDQTQTDRRSLRYTSTLRVPVTTFAQATVTVGADEWQSLTTTTTAQGTRFTGTLQDPCVANGYSCNSLERLPSHNTGSFIQAQLGVRDQLFFTYGLRAEWNPNYGKDAEPNLAPRYGVAYTTDLGPITAKIRGSYGRATRPPSATARLSRQMVYPNFVDVYGTYDRQLANPTLGPEYQEGREGGLELYLGQRASLVVTRYVQTVDGLIANLPAVDSVKSLLPNPTWYGMSCADFLSFGSTYFCNSSDANGYAYTLVTQNANVGSLRNQGWELQGTMSTGPLTTKGTYSWTKSRVIGIAEKYRAQFPPGLYPQYQTGATFNFLPEHTWALGMTYTQSRTTISLSVNGTGRLRNTDNVFFYQNLASSIRLRANNLNVSAPQWSYISFNRSYALTDLNATHRLSARVEGVLQVQNLSNLYVNDLDGGSAVMGRQTKIGFRIR